MKTVPAAELNACSQFCQRTLAEAVNEAKSAVAQPEERKFLGFSISNDGSERRIAPKALDKFKTQIRDLTRRTRGISLPQLIEDLTPYLIGWRGYFGFCQTPRVLTNLEAWIRRRFALVSLAAVAERAQSLQRTTPSWRAKVQCSGRRRFTDGVLAHVRTPGGPTSPAQPLFRLTRSSPTLRLRPSLTQSNRPVRTRMPGAGGGVASRGVPLSRSRVDSGPSPGPDRATR